MVVHCMQSSSSRRRNPSTVGARFWVHGFRFIPASYYLKKAAGLKSVGKRNRPRGAENPGRETIATVTVAQVREIAEAKMKDLSANDVEAAMKIILGSAKSMGIEVKG